MPSVTGAGESFGAAVRSAFQQASLGRARPSFDRVSPVARFRQLSRSTAGRRSLDLSGVNVTPRTERAWLTGQRRPSRRNATAIGRAYEAMRQGGIPEWVKQGQMEITGTVAYGPDIRNRGEAGSAPLRVDLAQADQLGGGGTIRRDRRGHWQAIEEDWPELTDDELEELIAEDLIAEDIGDGYPWGFPGGAYSVTISG